MVRNSAKEIIGVLKLMLCAVMVLTYIDTDAPYTTQGATPHGNHPMSVYCLLMNAMKLVIPLCSLYWSIHTKDESKRGTVNSHQR